MVLLDVDSVLPMTVLGSFRPRLRLMWPAGLMTPNLEWDEKSRTYLLTEESKRFAGVLGSPGARDLSVMPYQEEPKDLPDPLRDRDEPRSHARGLRSHRLRGQRRRDATTRKAAYDRLLASLPELYAANVAHYRRLSEQTVSIATPDPAPRPSRSPGRRWGSTRGSPRTPAWGRGCSPASGPRATASDRASAGSSAATRSGARSRSTPTATSPPPGPRSSSWAACSARTARSPTRSRRAPPGSRGSPTIPYPWNSADATPLFVIAHADHWRATGDRAFLDASFEAILKAWRFTAATDTDGNGLVENTRFGHGWVEGGDLYPPHEEIYQQGVWIEACRALAELAEARGDAGARRGGPRAGGADAGGGREDVLARGPRLLRLRHAAPARRRSRRTAARSAPGGRHASRLWPGAASPTRTP